jgi:hypothetical protein
MSMTEDLELEWARDLFDRTRGAGEPVWTADAMVLARSGDRRRRLRTAGAGGGLAGVVAVTAAVAVGLGAGTADLGSQPGPGGGWGNRPLADVFKHVSDFGVVDKSGHSDVPSPAATDVAAVLGSLDPSLSHLVGTSPFSRVVSPDDANAARATSITLSSLWTTAESRPAGQLSFQFGSSGGFVHHMPTSEPGADQLTGLCALAAGDHQSQTGPGTTPALSVRWSACTQSHLPDGSTVGSASVRIGEGTATVAVRQFADGEVFSVVAQDFWTSGLWNAPPDPTTVVHPTPWSEQSLVAALSDPAVRSGWHPIPPPDSDGRLLMPTDLGRGWSLDTTSVGDLGATQSLLIADGCVPDRNAALAESGSEARYRGTLPNGVPGAAYEGEYPVRSGSGAQTMADARAAAHGGCMDKVGLVDYSKNALVPLPAGIGDDAFAASVPGTGTVSAYVRVGDTILRTDLFSADHYDVTAQPAVKPLDLGSPADQQWLAGIARAMVSRYLAGMTGH